MDQTDDSSAGTLALMQQRVARALRLCGHHTNLDGKERVLTCDLYVLNWDKDNRMVETIDMEKLRILKEEIHAEDNTEETRLWEMSIDGPIYTRNVSPSAAPPLIVSSSEGGVMQTLQKVATAIREWVDPITASHTYMRKCERFHGTYRPVWHGCFSHRFQSIVHCIENTHAHMPVIFQDPKSVLHQFKMAVYIFRQSAHLLAERCISC